MKGFLFLILLTALAFPAQYTAHEVIPETILYIENQAVIYNPTPQSSNFKWGEHTLADYLPPNTPISFRINTSAIVEQLNTAMPLATWDFETDMLAGNNVNYTFDKTGPRYLSVTIIDEESEEEIYSDSIELMIGKPPAAPEIEVAGGTLENDTISTDRQTKLVFSVENPDLTQFEYKWDLADGDTSSDISVHKIFSRTKSPAAIVLRKIHKTLRTFSTDYVRIEIASAPEFEVSRPPNLLPSETLQDENIDINQLLVSGVVALTVLLAGINTIFWLKRRKSAH